VNVSVQLVNELAGSATEDIMVSGVVIDKGAGLILYICNYDDYGKMSVRVKLTWSFKVKYISEGQLIAYC
jgi:hypothetical protein